MQLIHTKQLRRCNNRVFRFVMLLIVFFALCSSQLAAVQVKHIKGTVKDSKGELLIGVTVVVKDDPSVGTITDFDGSYSLSVPISGTTLVFSYIGMTTVENQISGPTMNVTMSEDTQTIEEVVVVGYGSQKKATVTGAVSAVQTKELLQSPQANVSNALVGRMPGLTATQSSGEPGKDQANIRIRGVGTFSGSAQPLIMVDGVETPNFNNIDPNEIENVSILKDASATAVYGVRGANGVILITTKRGGISKPQISFSANFAFQNFGTMREQMNAYDWAKSYNEAKTYDGYITGDYSPMFTDEELMKFKDPVGTDAIFYPNTDWVDLMFKDYSTQMQYNVNVHGGTEAVKYFVSVGYYSQDGMFDNTDMLEGYDTQVKFSRYNIRANFDFKVTKNFKIAINMADQLSNRKGPDHATEYILSKAFAHPPTSGPGIVDGKIIHNLQGRYNFTANPIADLLHGGGNLNQYQNQLTGSVRGDYKLDVLIKGLSVHAMLSYQNFNSHTIRYVKDVITYNAVSDPNTGEAIFLPEGKEGGFSVGESFGKNRKNYFEAGINYARSFGSHDVGALLLYNQSKYHSPSLAFLIPNGYQGVVGRVTYGYKNRYMAEVNMGYNGTENFAPDKRFGFFPAFSLGWTMSEEDFYPENDWIGYLKVRGSYGEVGNDKIGGDRFLYMPTSYEYYNQTEFSYNFIPRYRFGTVGENYTSYEVSAEGKIGNPDLTWERAAKMNVGVDMTLWKDRIKITADFFKENRSSILTNRNSLPVIAGADMPAYNLGEMQNMGFDGEITFREKVGNFNYWARGIFTFARNKIIEMDEVEPVYEYQRGTGQRYGQFYGLIAEGFFNTWEEVNDVNRPIYEFQNNKIQPGDVKYKDVNGDGKIDSFDQVPIGYSAFPEISYGVSLGGDYKGFDFSILFQGSENVTTRTSKMFQRGFREDGGAPDYLKDYSWTPERYANGDEILFPHLSASSAQTNNYAASTLWIRDASYLRLKNVELGYAFQVKALKNIGIQSARIFVNGNNLWTWHGLLEGEDPEIPSYSDSSYEPYPIMRTFNIGLNVQF